MFKVLTIEKLYNLENTIAKDLFKGKIYPWEVLSDLSNFIIELGKTLDLEQYDKIDDNIWIHKTANVAKTASLTGPLIICENAEVRHCAFIRGVVIVGKGCVVGNSTEVKGSLLFDCVQVPHYNYVGDSVLGYKSHMGAGSITSNLKADKSVVCVSVAGEKINTGRKKFGAMVGDMVEIGCNSVLNPGTVIGKNSNVYPLSMVRDYIPKNSIYKNQGEVVEKTI